MQDAWPCYRLVVDGIATWTELNTSMTINDVADLCAADDLIFEARNPPPEKGS